MTAPVGAHPGFAVAQPGLRQPTASPRIHRSRRRALTDRIAAPSAIASPRIDRSHRRAFTDRVAAH